MSLAMRLLLALGLIAGIGLLAAWLSARQRRQVRMGALDGVRGPALLLITSPRCGACMAQKQVVERLTREWGEAGPTVVLLDAEQEAEWVRRMAIMTVPSTVLLAPDGSVAELNNGFASHAVLSEQWGRLRACSA